jgi:hypothetical protein
VSGNGQRFLYVKQLPSPPERPASLIVATNFFDELRRIVPSNAR